MSENEFKAFLNQVALEIHKSTRKPEILKYFQKQINDFGVWVDTREKSDVQSAMDNPNLRDIKFFDRKDSPDGPPFKGWVWETHVSEELEPGYWREVNALDRISAHLYGDKLPPFMDKNKERLLDYAIIAAIHDSVFEESERICELYGDEWVESDVGCISDIYLVPENENKIRAHYCNVKADIDSLLRNDSSEVQNNKRSVGPPRKPNTLVAEENIEWSRPMNCKKLATIFNVHRNTMAKWLKSQNIRNKKVSNQHWCVDINELPADMVKKVRAESSDRRYN